MALEDNHELQGCKYLDESFVEGLCYSS